MKSYLAENNEVYGSLHWLNTVIPSRCVLLVVIHMYFWPGINNVRRPCACLSSNKLCDHTKMLFGCAKGFFHSSLAWQNNSWVNVQQTITIPSLLKQFFHLLRYCEPLSCLIHSFSTLLHSWHRSAIFCVLQIFLNKIWSLRMRRKVMDVSIYFTPIGWWGRCVFQWSGRKRSGLDMSVKVWNFR